MATIKELGERAPLWLREAETENENVSIDDDGNVIWRNGDWIDGTWHNGIWLDGTWYNGTWRNGSWYNGAWIDGDWIDGTWHNGIWLDGTWHNGTWLDGTWHNGTWHNGYIESKFPPRKEPDDCSCFIESIRKGTVPDSGSGLPR